MTGNRGFFEIGIYHNKTETNIGTLWRSAYQLGASGIFTIGRRYKQQSSDTCKAWRHIPLRHYETLEDLLYARPYNCPIIGVETNGEDIQSFEHPFRCIYLLGAEDHGLSQEAINSCQQLVSLPSKRSESFNVSVAGSIIMYDRLIKMEG